MIFNQCKTKTCNHLLDFYMSMPFPGLEVMVLCWRPFLLLHYGTLAPSSGKWKNCLRCNAHAFFLSAAITPTSPERQKNEKKKVKTYDGKLSIWGKTHQIRWYIYRGGSTIQYKVKTNRQNNGFCLIALFHSRCRTRGFQRN